MFHVFSHCSSCDYFQYFIAIEVLEKKNLFLFLKVHITQGNLDGTAMIISWVTEDEPGSSEVLYGTDEDKLELSAEGKYTRYKFYNYTSGYIHHCTIRHLKVIGSNIFCCYFVNLYVYVAVACVNASCSYPLVISIICKA